MSGQTKIATDMASNNYIDTGKVVSEELANFALGLSLADIPNEVVRHALLCITDATGIAFASHGYPFANKGIQASTNLGSYGEGLVIGYEKKFDCRDSAFINGLLIHGLDYDDTHSESVIHATASSLPTVIAGAEIWDATPSELLLAYIIGVETSARIGLVSGGKFQKAGFHPTGLIGIFGSTLAASKIAKLSIPQIVSAQGIALSMASGSMQFLEDGSWTKRTHPGLAAKSALNACSLAKENFIGPSDAYSGRYGLFPLFLGQTDVNPIEILASLGETWELLNVAIKPYPVCHYNHACMDAAVTCVSENQIDPLDICSIKLYLHSDQFDVVCRPEDKKKRPRSEYDAKFSIQYCVATSIFKLGFGLAELNDTAINNELVLALADKISFHHWSESQFPHFFSGAIEIDTQNGDSFFTEEKVNRGSSRRRLTIEEVRQKFDYNVRITSNSEHAALLWQAIMSIPETESTSALFELLGSRR